jgi:hypothetical protein
MKIEPEYEMMIKGRASEVFGKLCRSLVQFISNNKKVKVGATGREPLKRLGEHLRNTNWKRCIVKYETSSFKSVKAIEKKLIDKFYDDLDNQTGGGGGLIDNSDLYYVYFLIK